MEVYSMRATLNIPDDLLKEVQKLSGKKSKTKAITAAMEDYIKQNKLKALLSFKGKTSLAFNWEAQETEELKAQAKREKSLGK
jgi:metal-responsive CopG/Arc/MetJ family transcriptional regulator